MNCPICGAPHTSCGLPTPNIKPVDIVYEEGTMPLVTSGDAKGEAKNDRVETVEQETSHDAIQARLAREKAALRKAEPVVGRMRRISDGAMFNYNNVEGDKLEEAGTHEWVERGRDVASTDTVSPITEDEAAKASRYDGTLPKDRPNKAERDMEEKRKREAEEKGQTEAPENKARTPGNTKAENK